MSGAARYPIEMKNRIRELRETKGLSQADLGDLLGIHWQSVQRAESGKTALTRSKQEAYAKALGITADELFTVDGFRTARVKGYVQAGHWAETWELPSEEQYEVPLPPDGNLAKVQLHAAELRGPSMNRRWPEGTVLIFTDAVETGEDIIAGKRYIVERERADGLREATVKKLWKDDVGQLWLLPESDDPRFQEPIALDGTEDDTIRIVGRVRYAVSRE